MMPLSLEVRENYLRRLLREGLSKSTRRIPYKGKTDYHNVYEIELKYLVYNRHNGRLETDMATWDAEEDIADEPYDEKIHQKIDSFLWESNPSKNRRTIVDLKEHGQLMPGIVTLDGVIIDGNRRAMCLARLKSPTFDAVILPDTYADSEEHIVRLETQYQLGEDPKLDYGPLEKYLKVKRLCDHLKIDPELVAKDMRVTEGEVTRYHEIMKLMDAYLNYIGCPGLYKLLKDNDGTKEGMFVDLYQDLKRFSGNGGQPNWVIDPDVDLLELKAVQFDYIRYGDVFSGTEKFYRKISHEGAGVKSFFAQGKIWEKFSQKHRETINQVTANLPSLAEYSAANPGFATRVEAAIARDRAWAKEVEKPMKENFFKSRDGLQDVVDGIEPTRLLERALNLLERIDHGTSLFVSDNRNLTMATEINQITYEMKRRFKKAGKALS